MRRRLGQAPTRTSKEFLRTGQSVYGGQPGVSRGSKREKKEASEIEELLPQGKYSMMQYAKEYFRQNAAAKSDTIRGTMGKMAGGVNLRNVLLL